jgi:hypothetical protein
LSCGRGPYQRIFHTTSLLVAVVATPGTRRAIQLLIWTQEELDRLQATERERELFMFTPLPPDSTPDELFFGDCWRLPFDSRPTSLLQRFSA